MTLTQGTGTISISGATATFAGGGDTYYNVAFTNTTAGNVSTITGTNTLTFSSAHGYTAGSRILYQTASQNGLIQSAYYFVLATHIILATIILPFIL